jgi:hypothetical protein
MPCLFRTFASLLVAAFATGCSSTVPVLDDDVSTAVGALADGSPLRATAGVFGGLADDGTDTMPPLDATFQAILANGHIAVLEVPSGRVPLADRRSCEGSTSSPPPLWRRGSRRGRRTRAASPAGFAPLSLPCPCRGGADGRRGLRSHRNDTGRSRARRVGAREVALEGIRHVARQRRRVSRFSVGDEGRVVLAHEAMEDGVVRPSRRVRGRGPRHEPRPAGRVPPPCGRRRRHLRRAPGRGSSHGERRARSPTRPTAPRAGSAPEPCSTAMRVRERQPMTAVCLARTAPH